MRNGGDSMIKTAFYDTKEYDKAFTLLWIRIMFV